LEKAPGEEGNAHNDRIPARDTENFKNNSKGERESIGKNRGGFRIAKNGGKPVAQGKNDLKADGEGKGRGGPKDGR